ncbi:MAG TPA: hypothetical protein V6C81_26135 [Planktothrix sp.]
MQPADQDQQLGAVEKGLFPTAKSAQRQHARTGEYLCEKCRTNFEYTTSDKDIVCPKCHNAKADSLTPVYIEEDPQETELMSKDEFHGGD